MRGSVVMQQEGKVKDPERSNDGRKGLECDLWLLVIMVIEMVFYA
jgi:hypothetical protein